MMTPVEIITPYVPRLVLRRCETRPGYVGADLMRVEAAVLFTDISGFTPLAETLARRGSGGSEELGHLLNAYYEPLIETISDHGGDVAKMAGDALVAVWTVEEGETLSLATLRAAQCGLAVQERSSDREVVDGLQLSLKTVVSAGELVVMHVGGALDRWELLIAGDPLSEIAASEQHARPGDVVLAPRAWDCAGEACEGMTLPGGCVRLISIRQPIPPKAIEMPSVGPESARVLWGYISGAIRPRLEAGQSGWLAEMRRVTVLFVQLPGLIGAGDDALRRTQEVMMSLQKALYHHEGSVNKLSVDEKGIVLVAAFGLPPLAHGDDAARGVLAGLAIREALEQLGERGAIGICTGRVYCGEIGGKRRREYTMIGDVVNLAARLMQASGRFGHLVCDEATARAARSRAQFEALPPITVKGKDAPIPAFRPLGRRDEPHHARPLFGRDPERAILGRVLEALLDGRGGVVVIEGDAGLGKSSLVVDLLGRAGSLGVEALVGGAGPIETNTPYFAWRPILLSLLGIVDLPDPESRRERVRSRFAADPDLATMAPLLNDVLGLDLPTSPITAGMTGRVRAENTRELLVRLIQDAAAAGPLALILEDVHWLDATSWALATVVADEVRPALLIVSTRPRDVWPAEALPLLRSPDATRIRLGPLTDADLLALACDRLNVREMPPAIASLLQSRAEGNALFGEELALSLRDAGLIVVEDGGCRLASGVVPEEIALPDSMHGAILGRIDRLDPSQQLTLKSASVIGRLFHDRVLRDIYPIESDRPRVGDDLSALDRLEFTMRDQTAPDHSHAFKHVITQEVAYQLMLDAQRRALHRSVAIWYEREASPDLGPFFPLLAHHWDRAGELDRAIEYLDRAGERALRGGSYGEAMDFFSRAEAAEGRSGLGEPTRRARREQALGESSLALGDLDESRAHTARALALLGRPVPANRIRQAVGLAAQLGLQAIRRLVPAAPPSGRDGARSALLASSADAVIGQLCYFDQDLLLGLHSALRSLNSAEAAGPSPELARAYATVAVAASLVPLASVARSYGERARDVAEGLDDLQARAWVLELVGIIELDAGRWRDGRAHLTEALRVAERIHDWRRWSEALGELARLDLHQGDFLAGREQFALMHERACRRGHEQARIWGLHGQALNCLRMGRDAEAAALLEESPALSGESIGLTDSILGGGLLAVARLRLEDREASLHAAEVTTRRIGSTRPMVGYSLDGYAGAAEVLLALGVETARGAVASLNQYARVFAIARPRARLLSGREHWRSGHRWRAFRAWRKALREAERLSLPYEQALAHADLATHLPPDDPARLSHLGRAREIFTRLGSDSDLKDLPA